MEMAWAQEAIGKRILHLEVGQPDFASPSHVVQAAKDALDAGQTKYISNAGTVALRKAVADMCNRRDYTCVTKPENIVVTVGSMLALYSTMQALLEPGDEILIPNPFFPNYEMTSRLLGAKAVHYNLNAANGYVLDPSQLKKLVTSKTKAILVNSPGNPTGAVFSLGVMQEISDFAREHGLFLISDEIYSDIVFESAQSAKGAKPHERWAPSILQTKHCPDRTIMIGGVAKNYSMTGFRVGWLRSSPEVATLISKLQEPMVSCGVPASQAAAQAALEGGQECVEHMREKYRARRDAALAVLKKNGLSNLVVSPKGAFYMLVGCETEDSRTFAVDLLREKGVAVAPGNTFGEQAKSSVRVAFAQDQAVIEEGMQLLCEYILSRRK
jgi:aspartate/methionine/tyrosine aminotransferase